MRTMVPDRHHSNHMILRRRQGLGLSPIPGLARPVDPHWRAMITLPSSEVEGMLGLGEY